MNPRYLFVVLLGLFLVTPFSLLAQVLDNENFESWIDNTAFEDPEGWVTLNDLSPEYGIPFTVLKSEDAKEGKYAAHMQSYTFLDGNNNSVTLASYLFYGTDIGLPVSYKWTKRLKTVSFYYKFKPNGIDTGAFYVSAGYKDKKTNTAITNGFGFYAFTKKEESYTKVNIPIYYNSNHKCDTILIAFVNSIDNPNGNRPKPGTILMIDDIDTEWEVFPPVVNVATPETEIGIYPNPATDNIYLKGLTSGNYEVSIIDITGKQVLKDTYQSGGLNVKILNPGLYNLIIHSQDKTYFGSQYFYKN